MQDSVRWSQAFIPTLREKPSGAEVISHILMSRAGMISKLSAGVYSYLPFGLKSLQKVEAIVREEMNRAGAIEVLMPALTPRELWMETGRYDAYGNDIFRTKDRKGQEHVLGPTHEEIITDIARRFISSYRDLPRNLYQIQTKFRDELRPRFGTVRGREFGMKDAYSFDATFEGMDKSFELMREAYTHIFQRCGLRFISVEADSGTIGGTGSVEFMALTESGEDTLITCGNCSYGANLEKAVSSILPPSSGGEQLEMQRMPTPGARTIEELLEFFKGTAGVDARNFIKTLIYVADGDPIAVLIRGDQSVNEVKLKNSLACSDLELAPERVINEVTGAPVGFAGPVGLKIPRYADPSVTGLVNAITGGNERDVHLGNVNIGRDYTPTQIIDVRNANPGEKCSRCGYGLSSQRGIELGHIFKLGTLYSEKMKAYFTDRDGRDKPFVMGCYGIGTTRIIPSVIEQSHDDHGIIWPASIAPFDVILTSVGRDAKVTEVANNLYHGLLNMGGINVLYDDRDLNAGEKFKDADLVGIPLRLTVGKRFLADGNIEVRLRSSGKVIAGNPSNAYAIITEQMR